MKKKRTILILVALLLVAGSAFLWQVAGAQSAEQEAPEIATAQITRGQLVNTLETTGTVAVAHTEKIRASFASEITLLSQEVGDEVKEGDLLATLDAETLEGQLIDTQTQIHRLEADRAALLAEGNLALNQGEEEAKRAYDLAKQTVADHEVLYAAGALSLAERDAARVALQNAEEALALARAKRAANNIGQELEIIESSLESARQQMASLEKQHQAHLLVAPSGGTVLSVAGEVGDKVGEGTVLMTIADLDHLEVTADISEYEVASLSLGMQVAVTPEGNGSKTYSGHITQIAPLANSSGTDVTVPIVIAIDAVDEQLRPGSTVSLKVIIDKVEDALLVPYDAITFQDGQRMVTVITEEGEEIPTPVTTGIDNDLYIAIEGENIAEGDQVKVTVLPATAPSSGGLPVPGVNSGMGGGGGRK